MRKVAYGLVMVFLLSILSSFGMMNAFADITIGDDESVIFDLDFSNTEAFKTKEDLANVVGLTLSGKYELAAVDAESPISNSNPQALKLCKDGVDLEEFPDAVAQPGTMILNWDNKDEAFDHIFRVEMELYNTGVNNKFLQSPITFMDIKDTTYDNGTGVDITRIAYDSEESAAAAMKPRVYAHILGGIAETSENNYLTVNDAKTQGAMRKWFTLEAIINTGTGDCSAVASVNEAQAQTRRFGDAGNFAPNQVTSIASSAATVHENDMYIKRIVVTGPASSKPAAGADKPSQPTPTPDYAIDSLKLVKDDQTAAANIAEAKRIDSVVVNRASSVSDNKFDVLIVEYKNGVFSNLIRKEYTPTGNTENVSGVVPLSVKVDEPLSAGTTSVKVMLWNTFSDLKPISESKTYR